MRVRRFTEWGWMVVLLVFVRWSPGQAQVQCAKPLNYTPVTQTNTIEWSKFPTFSLPFTMIYGGPRVDTQADPLKHGFTHLARFRDGEALPEQQRAIEWGGVAYGLDQPWETLESPWGNNMNAYYAQWDTYLQTLAGGRKNAAGKWLIPARVLLLDIERVQETDARILALKTNPQTPSQYRQLSNADFLAQYQKDMTALYAESIRYARERADLSNVPVSTYSDVPVRNTWFNIVGNSWQDWITNPGRVHFLVKDPTTNKVGGPFYQQLDFLAPSAYYYYDYPSPLAGDYLAYLLFQIEANRAWSDKPVIPFVWMRYHDCCGSFPNFIQPYMAEATAIFPFFAGAKGLWLWEGNLLPTDPPLTTYESFIHGLYRLSQFSDMFTGTYELVSDKSARDHMSDQTPIWRGVYKNNQLLIAAHNPYAADGQKTTLDLSYKTWKAQITLTGKEVYLCKFDLTLLGVEDPAPIADLTVSPNPARATATVAFTTTSRRAVEVQLINGAGQLVKSRPIQTSPDRMRLDLQLTGLAPGLYTLRVTDGRVQAHKKLLIVNE